MSDKMRWRYGETNPVRAAVDAETLIEIGDLLWLDGDDAKPASLFPGDVGDVHMQEDFVEIFLGVAMQRSRVGETDPIRVATTGVFEFNCAADTFELGDFMGPSVYKAAGCLDDQAVAPALKAFAIGRVARRSPTPTDTVLVDIRSTVRRALDCRRCTRTPRSCGLPRDGSGGGIMSVSDHIHGLEVKNERLKKEIRYMQEVAEARNRQIRASGYIVRCTGCMEGGPPEDMSEERVRERTHLAGRRKTMPTGYTAIIQERPTISFPEFAWRCARAMGACVMQRDDPMQEPPRLDAPNSYHRVKIEEAEAKLREVEQMTEPERCSAAEKEFADEELRISSVIQEKRSTEEAYRRMLDMVKAWNPPTPDHQGLKDFMIQQITDSIKWDCDTEFYDRPIAKLTGDEWRSKRLESLVSEIAYHLQHDAEEVERTRQRNEWKRQLAESLGMAFPA